MVQQILETQVSSEDLSDYLKNLIDSSDSISKPIYIDDDINASGIRYLQETFSIEEDTKSIHLVKKRMILNNNK